MYFCMQFVGDFLIRCFVFDLLIIGCIFVLFYFCIVYVQYFWYLFVNEIFWLVYILEDDVKEGIVNVVEIFKKILNYERDVMWEIIIKIIVLGLLYGVFGSDVFFYRDVFDIMIENLLYCVF